MTNIYEHHIYVMFDDDGGNQRIGRLETPMITTQPIAQLVDPFDPGNLMMHCAVCGQWIRNRCASKDPRTCPCVEINMINHVMPHGQAAFQDMARASYSAIDPEIKQALLEMVPGMAEVLGEEEDWSVSELEDAPPPETT